MANKPRIYLDSCCFIDAVKEAVGTLPTDRVNDAWFIKKFFEAHLAGEIIIHTSILSVAECVAIEPGQSNVPQEAQERFRAFLTSGQYVQLLSPTPATVIHVQKFRWEHGLVLAGADALHFAAALERGCIEFITTDNRLKAPKIAKSMPVLSTLGLRLIRASDTAYLPEKYRQGVLHA